MLRTLSRFKRTARIKNQITSLRKPVMKPEQLLCHSLRETPWGTAAARVMAAALAAVDPAAALRRHLRRENDTLIAGTQRYDLASIERIFVVGAGKAGAAMLTACAEVLGDALTAGIVVTKTDAGTELSAPPCCRLLPAGHPVPDQRGPAAAAAITDLLADTTERDLVITLISGGGSALLTRPAPGIALDDLQALTRDLLASGAGINEINSLRKHLDLVKGGGLARMAAPAPIVALILSDVVGNPLDVIASGPTVADSSSFADALAVLERYALLEKAPAAIRERLEAGQRGKVEETLKPGDPIFARVHNLLIAGNRQAAEAARDAAESEGFQSLLLTTYLQGEAREAGRFLAAVAHEVAETGRPIARPCCIIAGGETTVTLRGKGRGGRNQELALGALRDFAGIENALLIALASDGDDGPTDAAGAVISGASLARAAEMSLDRDAALANNDAYPFFAALDDLLLPGPTGTNVNDLNFVFMG
jgi:hydroxypyruvate reductase